MKTTLLALILVSAFSFSLQAGAKSAEPEINIVVRGLEPLNLDQEITKQEQLFRHIVVELELSIESDNAASDRPIVQVVPARTAGLDQDPRF
jgi:hypothetical protein